MSGRCGKSSLMGLAARIRVIAQCHFIHDNIDIDQLQILISNGVFECIWLSSALQLSMPLQNSHYIIQKYERQKCCSPLQGNVLYCCCCYRNLAIKNRTLTKRNVDEQTWSSFFITVTVTSNSQHIHLYI